MSSRLVETFTYSCPHCGVELEAPASRWDGWVRCPSCARTFLPPEPERLPRGMSASAAASSVDGIQPNDGSTVASPEFEATGVFTGRHVSTSGARLVFITGLVLCMFLSLIFFLVHEPGKLGIFGALSIGFFLLLLRNPRKRLPPVSPS
jgi:hypothetical protein